MNSARAGTEPPLSNPPRTGRSVNKVARNIASEIRSIQTRNPSLTRRDTLNTEVMSEDNVEMNNSKMPAPEMRHAPKFDPEAPEGLLRFLSRLDDLFQEKGVADDKKRKEWAVKYTDPTTEEEWRAFTSFDKGTWEDFKKAIIASYPVAANASKGTLRKLRQICANNARIGLEDLEPLEKLIRSFRAEAIKLQKPPSLISNRELVELFLGCLNQEFRNSVYNRLSVKAVTTSAPEQNTNVERRVEDQYSIDEVMDTASQIGARGNFGFTSSPTAVPTTGPNISNIIKREIDGVREELAMLQDKQVVQEKQLRAQLNEVMQQTRAPSAPPMQPRNNNFAPMQRMGAVGGNNGGFKCHYCHVPGHFMDTCEMLIADKIAGRILYGMDRRLRWPDGSVVPREPSDKSYKEKIDLGQTKVAQMLFSEMEDYDIGPGIIPINGPNFNQPLSMYLNQPYDRRDAMIEDLLKKVHNGPSGNMPSLNNSFDRPLDARAPIVERDTTAKLLEDIQQKYNTLIQNIASIQKSQSGSSSGNSGF